MVNNDDIDLEMVERAEAEFNKHALMVAKTNSSLRAEQAREQIDPVRMVTELYGLLAEADNTTIEELPRLVFKSTVYTTLLKKVLPDLKSMEVKEGGLKANRLLIDMPSTQGVNGKDIEGKFERH